MDEKGNSLQKHNDLEIFGVHCNKCNTNVGYFFTDDDKTCIIKVECWNCRKKSLSTFEKTKGT